MNDAVTLTVDQIDAVDRSLNKAMAAIRVLANCGHAKRPIPEPPEAVDMFLMMQMVLEELEKVQAIVCPVGAGMEQT